MPPSSALVELRNVTFSYGDRVILRDLSLSVPRGKVTALMGASGGGKTTLLDTLAGTCVCPSLGHVPSSSVVSSHLLVLKVRPPNY